MPDATRIRPAVTKDLNRKGSVDIKAAYKGPKWWDGHEPSIIDIMPNALQLLGGDIASVRGLPTWATRNTAQQIVVWLIDGFGYHQIQEALNRQLMPHLDQILKTRKGHLESMMTVFPSMTPVALASLMTGSFPEQHGIVGQVVQVDHQSVDVIAGPLPNSLRLESPGVAELARHSGIPYRVVIENRLRHGALTTLLHQDADRIDTFVVASGLPVMVNQALDQEQTGIIYVYWSGPDSINHARGAYGPEWVAEVKWLDQCLYQLVSQTRPGSWLWITADHGHIPLAGALPYAELREHWKGLPELPPMVGTGVSLDVDNVEAFKTFLAEWSSVPVAVVRVSELWRAGFFGPSMDFRFQNRLGSHVLMPPSGWYWQLNQEKLLKWSHGGHRPEEMTIPWIEIDLGGSK